MAAWSLSFCVAMCVERCGLGTWSCKTHCNGCMYVTWASFWGKAGEGNLVFFRVKWSLRFMFFEKIVQHTTQIVFFSRPAALYKGSYNPTEDHTESMPPQSQQRSSVLRRTDSNELFCSTLAVLLHPNTHKYHPPIKQPNSGSLRPELISTANIGHVTIDI